MLGATWQATLDAALDEINRRDRDRQEALDAIGQLLRAHPDLEQNLHLTTARLALQR